MKINVYDFDKTIYDGDSSVDFYLFCLRKNISIIFRVPSFLFCFLLYKLKKKSKEELKENFFSFLKNINDIDQVVKDFWLKNYKKIKKFYLDSKHSKDIIISASPEFLLIPICEKLKVYDVLASKVDKRTGKYLGLNCYGEEKVKRLKNKYKDVLIDNVYTDSYSDMPLIKISDNSFIVKKDKIVKYDKKEV